MKQRDEFEQRRPRQALTHMNMEFVADAVDLVDTRNSLEPLEKRPLVAL
jgi:hypothetical protein